MNETKDIWIFESPREASLKARRTLEKLGRLTHVEPGVSLTGEVKFGVEAVELRITWREDPAPTPAGAGDAATAGFADAKFGGAATATREATKEPLPGTTIVVTALGEPGVAARNAIERFEDALLRYGDPDYRPDKLGVLPITIIAAFVALLLLGVAIWRSPWYRKRLPNMPVPKAIQVSPAPAANGGG